MTIKLKQSTASQEIPLGYFVDSTDGNTEKTALTNTVVWSLTIVPLAKVITLSGTIGFAVTLTGTANVTGQVVGGQ